MSIKSDLLCGICKKIFKEPIFLPCHCTVCKEHVEEFTNKSKMIKCNHCDEEFDVPSNGFKENSRLKLIIEKNAHLSEEEKDLKNNIESNYVEYQRVLKELKLKEAEFKSISFDHFAEIRRNIDLRRETLKQRIDNIAEEMIEKAKKLEESYKKDVELTNKLNHSEEDFQNETQKLVEMFRDPDILRKSAIVRKLEHDGKLAELQAKLNRYDWLKHYLKAYKFEKNFEFENDFFGYLKHDETPSSGFTEPIHNIEESLVDPLYDEYARDMSWFI